MHTRVLQKCLAVVFLGLCVWGAAQARIPLTEQKFGQWIQKEIPDVSKEDVATLFPKYKRIEKEALRLEEEIQSFKAGVKDLKDSLQDPASALKKSKALKQICAELEKICVNLKTMEEENGTLSKDKPFKLGITAEEDFKHIVQELDGAITSFGENTSPEVQEVVDYLRRTKQSISTLL